MAHKNLWILSSRRKLDMNYGYKTGSSLTDTQTPNALTVEYAGRSDYFAMTHEHFHPH